MNMFKDWRGISTSKSLNLEGKIIVDDPTPEMINIMVKNAVKSIKKPKGVSAEDICKYIELKYDTKVSKSLIEVALNEGLDIGTYQKVNEHYFIQENTPTKKDFRNTNKNCPDPEFKSFSALPESLNPDSKTDIEVTTPGLINIMVKNAIKFSKTPKGTSLEGICKYIEENYEVKVSKNDINKVLSEGIKFGIFEKRNGGYFFQKQTFRRKSIEDMDTDMLHSKLNDTSTCENLNPHSKEFVLIPTPERINKMVNNAINHLKKPNGASLEHICKYIEDNNGGKVSKIYIYKVLDEGVSLGTFVKINGHYFAAKRTSSKEENKDIDIDFPDPKLNVIASTSKSLNPQSKAAVTVPTPEMINTIVKNAVKCLKKPSGASLEEVFKYIKDNYEIKVSKNNVNEALREGVNVGTFEKINGVYFLEKEKSKRKVFVEQRFKMYEEKPTGLEKEPKIRHLTREMVIMMVKYSIKNLKKTNGASFIDICSYMEEHYRVNMKLSELSIRYILNDMVSQGVLETITGDDEIERFRLKEKERRK